MNKEKKLIEKIIDSSIQEEKERIIRELKKNTLEYGGSWMMKDKDGMCKKFTMSDLIQIIK